MTNLVLHTKWVEDLQQCNRLVIGFSGGLDSTVLLHLLASYPALQTKLLAVHVNHGISPNASLWQQHCQSFCAQLGVLLQAYPVEFDKSANVEEEARKARYGIFSSILDLNDGLVLAHHQDDQAETVLLQLFRGAGVDGLAAMSACSKWDGKKVFRPLLSYLRCDLEHYAALHDLRWVDDESNEQSQYSRNYLRHHFIPLLKEKWPNVVTNLARTASHCQDTQSLLRDLAQLDLDCSPKKTSRLSISLLKQLSRVRAINALRFWFKENQIQMPSTVMMQRIIDEVLGAEVDAMPMVCWSNVVLCRYQDYVYLRPSSLLSAADAVSLPLMWFNFPQPISYLGHWQLSAKQAAEGLAIPNGGALSIRFRQGGECMVWRGQTKRLKKLLQEWQVPPWIRDSLPLLYIGNELAVVVGYAISDLFYSRKAPCWVIQAEQ